MKTIEEITRTMKLHHIASRRGYISRKSAGKVESYMRKETEMLIECADAHKAVEIFLENHPESLKWGETLGAMAKRDANIDDDRKKCGKFNPDWTHFIILEVHKGQTFIYIAEHVEI